MSLESPRPIRWGEGQGEGQSDCIVPAESLPARLHFGLWRWELTSMRCPNDEATICVTIHGKD